MKYLAGKKGSDGVAYGPILKWDAHKHPEKEYTEDIIDEKEKLQAAITRIKNNTASIMMQSDSKTAEILEAQMMILEDQGFLNRIDSYISNEGFSAAYACYFVGQEYEKRLEALEDEYLKARAIDIRNISQKMIQQIKGEAKRPQPKVPSIIIADEISPEELSLVDKTKLLAIVTKYGSAICHTAILANNYGIPYLYGVDYEEKDFEIMDLCIVDTYKEVMILNPDAEEKMNVEEKMKALPTKNAVIPHEVLSKIKITANVDSLDEIDLAKANGAQGIGLFRTEFLYMNRDGLPSEEEQYDVYRTAIIKMKGKVVVFRTIDAGADKVIPCMDHISETNPALGHRGIRLCLENPDLFQTQLRALFRAAVYGNMKILFPMIASLSEIAEIKMHIAAASDELKSRNMDYRVPPIGIMIETPAAAILSQEMAKEVDFFSIGTNDLTQYVFAIDRNGKNMERYYPKDYVAILRFVEMIVKNAHAEGIEVSVCGELAGNTAIIPKLIDIGVDSLSMSPYKIKNVGK